MVRVWKFLIPDSGEHTFQVENIGAANQRAWIDGVAIECNAGQVQFSGPEGCFLRLKQESKGKMSARGSNETAWSLLVDERIVEEVCASGEGLRDLRHMAEGSYLIATGFSADGVSENACRKFEFFIDSEPHQVVVAHKECIWQVALDGTLIDQTKHALKETEGQCIFEVPISGGGVLDAVLQMTWNRKEVRWAYSLSVGDVAVPFSWTKVKGQETGAAPIIPSGKVDVASAGYAASAPVAVPAPAAVPAEPVDKENLCPVDPDTLPQGVSYDREARAFQANIKDPKSNRFIFLGEFATPEAAHEKYKEALSRYAPEKRIAPST